MKAGTATTAEIDALALSPSVRHTTGGVTIIEMPKLPDDVRDEVLTRYARRIEDERRCDPGWKSAVD